MPRLPLQIGTSPSPAAARRAPLGPRAPPDHSPRAPPVSPRNQPPSPSASAWFPYSSSASRCSYNTAPTIAKPANSKHCKSNDCTPNLNYPTQVIIRSLRPVDPRLLPVRVIAHVIDLLSGPGRAIARRTPYDPPSASK